MLSKDKMNPYKPLLRGVMREKRDRTRKNCVSWRGACVGLGVGLILGLLLCSIARAGEKEDVASVIAAEACGEGERGMHGVGSVILNRSRVRHIPPDAVVKQRNQFMGWTAGNRMRLYNQCRQAADRIAQEVINGTLPDVTNGAQYFLLPGEPKRKWHGVATIKIGQHQFYQEAK